MPKYLGQPSFTVEAFVNGKASISIKSTDMEGHEQLVVLSVQQAIWLANDLQGLIDQADRAIEDLYVKDGDA